MQDAEKVRDPIQVEMWQHEDETQWESRLRQVSLLQSGFLKCWWPSRGEELSDVRFPGAPRQLPGGSRGNSVELQGLRVSKIQLSNCAGAAFPTTSAEELHEGHFLAVARAVGAFEDPSLVLALRGGFAVQGERW